LNRAKAIQKPEYFVAWVTNPVNAAGTGRCLSCHPFGFVFELVSCFQRKPRQWLRQAQIWQPTRKFGPFLGNFTRFAGSRLIGWRKAPAAAPAATIQLNR
jgi:hypothetical protein